MIQARAGKPPAVMWPCHGVSMTERFAIYYAPSATSNLWERAATWLGRDASDGEFFSGPVAGIDRNRLLNLTQSANRYGFHATLKAPMALAPDLTEAELRAALEAFASRHHPVPLGQPRVSNIDGFLALTVAPNEALTDLAAHVVEDFEPFRAPMSMKEHAARAAHGLSERQLELLDAYGYPYVYDQFFFHMTLTDRLAPEDVSEITQAAETWFGPALEEPLVLDRLSLFHEPDTGKLFRRVADFKLSPA
jgi:putative phosphonate metabolism protein